MIPANKMTRNTQSFKDVSDFGVGRYEVHISSEDVFEVMVIVSYCQHKLDLIRQANHAQVAHNSLSKIRARFVIRNHGLFE